jgi:imidazolonepropionase-like amidohydrolase
MFAITGGNIYTMTNGIIKDGVILVKDNKILDIGEKLSIPDGYKIINADGSSVIPGLIDAHTHIGVLSEGLMQLDQDNNEMTDPITPHVRVIDSIDPFDPIFEEVLQAGITTVMIAPGSANPIGGQCSVVKTCGKTVEEMLMVEDAGMKFALGDNPKRVYGSQKKAPMTRMGVAAVIRETLQKANNYQIKKEESRDKEEKCFKDVDFKLEALQSVINGKVKARIHCHKASDIMTAIRISEEFDLDITLEHCTEGYKIISEIARRKIPAVLSPLMNPRSKPETRNRSLEIAGQLANNGVLTVISTDGISLATRWLAINAGVCVSYGMKEEDALKAITINPAIVLGIADRVGSLEKGKDADIVIMKGHPLETRTRTGTVILGGKIKYYKAENMPRQEEQE